MTVYNGDVNVNPNLMLDVKKAVVDLTSSVKALQGELIKATKRDTLLQVQIESLTSELKALRVSQILSSADSLDVPDVEIINISDVSEYKLLTHTYNVLNRAGIYTVQDFDYVDIWTLKRVRNLGVKTLEDIQYFLKEVDVELQEEFEESPQFPEISEGDIVESTVAVGHFNKGLRLEVIKVHPVMRSGGRIYRAVPGYLCKRIDSGASREYSVTQLRRLSV